MLRAKNESELINEKTLIINPIVDNPLELFVLVFKQSSKGKKVLELKPKHASGYLYEKAVESIKLFSLGDCEENRHKNENVHQCRIELLQKHFNIFYPFAKALKEGKKKEAFLVLSENREVFEGYGFFSFLKQKDSFEIVV